MISAFRIHQVSWYARAVAMGMIHVNKKKPCGSIWVFIGNMNPNKLQFLRMYVGSKEFQEPLKQLRHAFDMVDYMDG